MDQRTPISGLEVYFYTPLHELRWLIRWHVPWKSTLGPARSGLPTSMETYMQTSLEKQLDKEVAVQGRRRRRSAGVVVVEYAFLLVFFGIPVIVGTMALGVHMIKGYGDIRNDLLHVGP